MIKTSHRIVIETSDADDRLVFEETIAGTLSAQQHDPEQATILTSDDAIDLGKRLAAWGRRAKKAASK